MSGSYASPEKCSSCKFWFDTKTKTLAKPTGGPMPDYFSCMRFAPHPVVDSSIDGIVAVWPLTTANDFCGDWKPRV